MLQFIEFEILMRPPSSLLVFDSGKELGVQDCVLLLVEVHEEDSHDSVESSEQQNDEDPHLVLVLDHIESLSVCSYCWTLWCFLLWCLSSL